MTAADVLFERSDREALSEPECNTISASHYYNFSANNDRYDAYLRDGLQPWIRQFDRVHALVHGMLAVRHEQRAGEMPGN